MKKVHFIFALGLIISLFFINLYAQKTIPSIKVKNMNGGMVDTKTFNNNGKPYVISFWATWCHPCVQELNALSEVYAKWQKETGVKVIAISIDDARNSRRVPGYVKSRKWAFEVYVDENSDFHRAMNSNHPPHTYLVNGKGEIVWQHVGYAPGDENELYKEIKKLTK
ncbi:MAG: TlpA disulfide reductase family protein [Candidatus Kapabacteria bacterium]|nr:TlpA disulfide reductase family protein [Candidatus Kapabacteria bacterium]